jgi:hypothetical protein
VGGKWSSGLPFLNAKLKKQHPSKVGIKLDLVSVDSAPLKVPTFPRQELVAMPFCDIREHHCSWSSTFPISYF